MNRLDTLKLRTVVAQFVNDCRMRYDDMPDKTQSEQREKAKFGREIDEAVGLYHKLKVAPYSAQKQPKQTEVGKCPCGAAVTVSDRYSVPTEGYTTITRVCQECGRTNDIELTMIRELKVVDWKVCDCICGKPVRLRSDYAGFGFAGYLGTLDFRGTTRKNRTATTTCSCGCKWTFKIRFAKIKSGANAGRWERTIPDIQVGRCASCRQVDVPGMTPVEPKAKKRAAGAG